jgi:hypothetical protein
MRNLNSPGRLERSQAYGRQNIHGRRSITVSALDSAEKSVLTVGSSAVVQAYSTVQRFRKFEVTGVNLQAIGNAAYQPLI